MLSRKNILKKDESSAFKNKEHTVDDKLHLKISSELSIPPKQCKIFEN